MNWQEEMRKSFPISEKKTYMEMGFFNGGATFVADAYRLFFDECFSGKYRGKSQWYAAECETRELLAQLLGGVPAKNIAYTKNTSEGLNIIAHGFDWKPGDNVITNDQEHVSNLYPWLNLERTRGVECRVIKGVDHRLPLELYEKAVDEHTRMIAVSHVEAPTGYRVDLEELSKFCHERGIFLVTDCIQSLGIVECNAKKWKLDAVASGIHKGLLAIPGTGLLYLSDQLMEHLTPVFCGFSDVSTIHHDEHWTSDITDKTDARQFEVSNRNYPGIYGLRAGLQKILEIGVDNIEEYILGLSDKLNQGLRDLGYNVITPAERKYRANLNSVIVPDLDGMKEYCYQHNLAVSKMDLGTVRFSMGVYSNMQDVEHALEVAEAYKKTI